MSRFDCSVISPLCKSGVFSSTGSSPEPEAIIKTSVSVSSLTEIFEKSGDFGCVTENCGQSAIATDTDTVFQKVKNTNSSCAQMQRSTSATGIDSEKEVQSGSQDSFELDTEAEVTRAVEERVAYFVEKILQNSVADTVSKNIQNSAPEEADKDSSSEYDKKFGGVVQNISLKDLEQSFVSALNMANSYEKESKKNADTLSLPSIQITEASDREDSSSDEAAEIIIKVKDNKTEVKSTAVNTMEEDTELIDVDTERDMEISPEERRAVFYISSSDLPTSKPSENSDFRQRSVKVEERMEYLGLDPVLIDNSENKCSSCLFSKSVHGAIFLVSFVVAIAGFILYNLAHDGKVPDVCQHLGLVTAIFAGIIGAFSCSCYSLLEAFPAIPASYQKMRESRNIESDNETNNDAENLDKESLSSEKEAANERREGMSPTCTSPDNIKSNHSGHLLIRESDHRELVETTEKLKKEVMEILDSLSDVMAKIKQVDVIEKMDTDDD